MPSAPIDGDETMMAAVENDHSLLRAVGVDCIEILIERADVNGTVGSERGRRFDCFAGRKFPFERAAGITA